MKDAFKVVFYLKLQPRTTIRTHGAKWWRTKIQTQFNKKNLMWNSNGDGLSPTNTQEHLFLFWIIIPFSCHYTKKKKNLLKSMFIYILNKKSLCLTLFIGNHCFLNSLSIYKHHLLEFYCKSLSINIVYHWLPIKLLSFYSHNFITTYLFIQIHYIWIIIYPL